MEAELWEAYYGLEVAWFQGYAHVDFGMDFAILVAAFNSQWVLMHDLIMLAIREPISRK